MDRHTQATRIKKESQTIKLMLVPAQLFIGPHNNLVAHTQKYLQQLFCKQDACSTCITCKQITNEQHHAIIWLAPATFYTREQLEPLFKTIRFALNEGQRFFFVIQKADFLTPVCANSLLKSLEEPPPGYHFILLAERLERILPTIRSRCIITTLHGNANAVIYQELFAQLVSPETADPAIFLKALDQSKINERESIELLDALFKYWIDEYKKAVFKSNQPATKKTQDVIKVLQDAIANPPMPGSSKLLWRNLFLQMSR